MVTNHVIVVMDTNTVANGSTIYSQDYRADYATGFAAVLVTLAGASNVTITQQASMTGTTTFYDVVSSTGSALGAVLTAGTTTSAATYIQFAPVIGRHNRFKVVAAAASTVTISVISSEQS